MKRLADSYITIEGHYWKKYTFSGSQAKEDEKLSYASCVADVSQAALDVDQHLWDSGGSIAEVQKGEISQKEVHGGVESGLEAGQENDGWISKEGHYVEGGDGHKKNHF